MKILVVVLAGLAGISVFLAGYTLGVKNTPKTSKINEVSELQIRAWQTWLPRYDHIKRLTKEFPSTVEDLTVLQGCACLVIGHMALMDRSGEIKAESSDGLGENGLEETTAEPVGRLGDLYGI